jgi:cell shape-determining protein MreD
VLYKYAFKQSAKNYYIRNYTYILVFAVALIGLNFCMLNIENQWIQLLVNGCISVAISLGVAAVAVFVNKDFRHYVKVFLNRIKSIIAKKV